VPQRQRAPYALPSPLCPAGNSVGQRSHVDLVGWVDGFPARALGGRFEGRNRRVEKCWSARLLSTPVMAMTWAGRNGPRRSRPTDSTCRRVLVPKSVAVVPKSSAEVPGLSHVSRTRQYFPKSFPLTRVRVRGKLIHGAPRPTKLSALRSKKLISEHVGHSRADSCWTCLRREPQRTSTDRTQNACSSPSQRKWSTSARMQSSMPPAPGAARTPSEEEHRTSTTQSRCPPSILDAG